MGPEWNCAEAFAGWPTRIESEPENEKKLVLTDWRLKSVSWSIGPQYWFWNIII
jgi:hypothetical protein